MVHAALKQVIQVSGKWCHQFYSVGSDWQWKQCDGHMQKECLLLTRTRASPMCSHVWVRATFSFVEKNIRSFRLQIKSGFWKLSLVPFSLILPGETQWEDLQWRQVTHKDVFYSGAATFLQWEVFRLNNQTHHLKNASGGCRDPPRITRRIPCLILSVKLMRSLLLIHLRLRSPQNKHLLGKKRLWFHLSEILEWTWKLWLEMDHRRCILRQLILSKGLK